MSEKDGYFNFTDVSDPCARKHGGNENSVSAWERQKEHVETQNRAILRIIREAGEEGATSKECAAAMGVQLNRISGRFRQLFLDGLIVNRGGRKREGAAVWVIR